MSGDRVPGDVPSPAGARRTRPPRARRTRNTSPLLSQILSTAVELDPAKTAVVSGDVTVSYAELDRLSSRIARVLISQGVGPEDVVAIGITRSLESVLAVWSIAKTGAAFLPVDPTYPADRVEHMLADSGARVGLTTTRFRGSLSESCRWNVLDDEDFEAATRSVSDEKVAVSDRTAPSRTDNPAYVIYTSGSTGLPKGVVVTHRGIADLAGEQLDRYGLTAASRTLHFASPSFDASVLELLMAVAAGSTMIVAPADIYGGDELADFLRIHAVTHAFVTPAALASVDPTGLSALEAVIVGGENCPPELVESWGADRRFFNAYGPTESTVASNISDALTPGDPVVIGRAIAATTAHVLDRRLRPVPTGVAGELYLAGAGLARGYRERPALTSDRFVANPFTDSASRMYRTGDVVRQSPSGSLEFVARNDFQVKVRGFRIELGEIDTALTAHPAVAFAVTIGVDGPAGDTALVSYVRPAATETLDPADLTSFVSRTLPKHMIPSSVMVIDSVPLTPAGKLDRDRLPAPQFATKEYRAPRSDSEQAVATVFSEILGLDQVGLDDDFFELGGNSLSATRLAARIGAALDVGFGAKEVFEDSTVDGLARAAEARTGGPRRVVLGEATRPDRIPLSLAQQRMWFLNRFDTESAAYNIPIAIRLTGALDVDALRAAIGDVVARHEPLRTIYPSDADGPMQQILPETNVVDVAVVDVTESSILGEVQETASTSFDVTTEVPIRVRLFRLSESDHVLAFVVQHISADGGSMGPLTRDVMVAYAARVAGTAPNWVPLGVQYADFAVWQRKMLGDEQDANSVAHQQLSFWKSELSGLPDQIELPTDRPRPAMQSFDGGRVDFSVDAAVQEALSVLARGMNATLFMAVHAAWAALLSRLSGSTDIAIGSPIAGRGEAALDDLIGMFANTLVFRTEIDPAARFDGLVSAVREVDVRALANADVPFERLVEVLNPVRSTSRHPLFQVGLSFQNLEKAEFQLPGLAVSGVEADAEVAQFDLHLIVSDQYDEAGTPTGIGGTLKYAAALFDESTARSIADRFVSFLSAVAGDPGVVVGDVDVVGAVDRAMVVESWNDTAHEVDSSATLVSLFDARVAADPDSTALVFGSRSWSYAEFDARVNRLARYLVTVGVGPESSVAVAMRRSEFMVAAMFAVVKAGAAYVPVDPDQPADRTGYVLKSAAPVVVLVAGRDGGWDVPVDVPVVDVESLDLGAVASGPVSDSDRRGALRPDNAAYVIFTSGSTGRPKGVAVSHRAVVNQLEWERAEYGLGSADVSLLKTAATFDLSVWELWSWATTGGRLVIASADGHRDPVYLASLIERESVTTLHVVPSVLGAIVEAAGGALPSSVRRVLAIGEALPASTARAVLEGGARLGRDLRLDNVYGPTEAAVSVTSNRIVLPVDAVVPIGRPEWNCQVFVLDSRLHPVSVGVVGELYLAGVQLARGYAGREDLTSERFVANPFSSGSRMYRTGDLVRWTADGVLDYVGRSDFQVKIRGFRIELGEIESVLGSVAGIRDAVVIAHSDERVGDRLVAYIVGDAVDVDAVKRVVGERLPSYMVPSAFVVLSALPLTANGKLDRGALPEPEVEVREFRAPSSAVEVSVATVFGEVLGVGRVGLDDDFFELGGNSLVATQVVARLSESAGFPVPLLWMFSGSTVGKLAARIAAGPMAAAGADAALEVVLPIRESPSRRRLWCLHPIVGVSWAFGGLAGALDEDWSITALQSPALTETDWDPKSIEEWASRYVDEIQAVQPEGPYDLLGWSLGGVLAHAIAVRLQSKGAVVSTLAMMDSHLTNANSTTEVGENAAPMTLADLFGGLLPSSVADGKDLSADSIAAAVAVLPAPFGDISPVRVERVIAGAGSATEAIANYRPEKFLGRIVFFTAGVDDPTGSIGASGWDPYVSDGVDNHVLSATHWGIASPDNLRLIAAVVGGVDRL